MSDYVLIERDSSDVGKPGRVYVTGPHFGRGVYSSTRDRSEASRFTRAEVDRLFALGKWRHLRARLIEVDE
jgi:hypothetical protein